MHLPPVNLKPVEVTEELYEFSIPACCRLTTLNDHVSIMYCWSLLNSLRDAKPMHCGLCEFNTEFTPAEYKKLIDEQTSKRKIWEILSDTGI